ncbi:MAG: hypothetical protein Q4C87_00440 [Actinomycetaceae bacterium]|nr:hypothetical protein [Actinomycetaceae bacterium]
MTEDIREQIEDILNSTFVAEDRDSRSQPLLKAIDLAREYGHEDLEVRAEIQLAGTYLWTPDRLRAFAPFSSALAKYKEKREIFSDISAYLLLWYFKMLVTTAAASPEISREQLDELIADCQTVYRAEGASFHAVHGVLAKISRILGDSDKYAENVTAWRASQRDRYSDCAGCDPEIEVRWLISQGDYAAAIHAAAPVLTGEIGCGEQPKNMRAIIASSLHRCGEGDQAWKVFLSSSREYQVRQDGVVGLNDYMDYLLVAGHIRRGLKLIRDNAAVVTVESQIWHLAFYLAYSSAMLKTASDNGAGEEPLGVAITLSERVAALIGVHDDESVLAADTPLSKAADVYAYWARYLAEQFDRRNGSRHTSQAIEQVINRRPESPIDTRELAPIGYSSTNTPDTPRELLDRGRRALIAGDLVASMRVNEEILERIEEDIPADCQCEWFTRAALICAEIRENSLCEKCIQLAHAAPRPDWPEAFFNADLLVSILRWMNESGQRNDPKTVPYVDRQIASLLSQFSDLLVEAENGNLSLEDLSLFAYYSTAVYELECNFRLAGPAMSQDLTQRVLACLQQHNGTTYSTYAAVYEFGLARIEMEQGRIYLACNRLDAIVERQVENPDIVARARRYLAGYSFAYGMSGEDTRQMRQVVQILGVAGLSYANLRNMHLYAISLKTGGDFLEALEMHETMHEIAHLPHLADNKRDYTMDMLPALSQVGENEKLKIYAEECADYYRQRGQTPRLIEALFYARRGARLLDQRSLSARYAIEVAGLIDGNNPEEQLEKVSVLKEVLYDVAHIDNPAEMAEYEQSAREAHDDIIRILQAVERSQGQQYLGENAMADALLADIFRRLEKYDQAWPYAYSACQNFAAAGRTDYELRGLSRLASICCSAGWSQDQQYWTPELRHRMDALMAAEPQPENIVKMYSSLISELDRF